MKSERYSILRNRRLVIPSATTEYISVSRNVLIAFMRNWIGQIRFDPAWYVATYPDIADALKAGVLQDPREHYLEFGYFENRMPYEIRVDEDWYLTEYADVRKAIDTAAYQSAQEHFVRSGYREGRLPYAGFELEVPAEIPEKATVAKRPAATPKRRGA